MTYRDVQRAKSAIIAAAYRGAPSGRMSDLVDKYTKALSDYVRETVEDDAGAELLLAIAERRK